MTKVGHYTYSLRPLSGGRGKRAVAGERDKTGGRKEIVWSVAVEAGRRLLTLRSALEVVNKAGLDLQLRSAYMPQQGMKRFYRQTGSCPAELIGMCRAEQV
jgi:hypothetical protein